MADSLRIDLTQYTGYFAALQAKQQKFLPGLGREIVPDLLQAEADIKGLLSGPVLKRRSGTLAASVGVERPTVQGETSVSQVGVLKPTAAQKYADLLLH